MDPAPAAPERAPAAAAAPAASSHPPSPPPSPRTSPPPSSSRRGRAAAAPRAYVSPRHRDAAFFLHNAMLSGKLGSAPPEPAPRELTFTTTILRTVPWRILFVQAVWSSLVVLVAWAIAKKRDANDAVSDLSVAFWQSITFSLNASVINGVGWALFVLLAFFVREASSRHHEALMSWAAIASHMLMLVRHVRQLFPPATWHEHDLDRLIAHLLAYPIALKMTLRAERQPEQLKPLLHEKDVHDIIAAREMHIHCMRVVRAYFTSSEPDVVAAFQTPINPQSPAGDAARYLCISIVDSIDFAANAIVRIGDFRPAEGYINHLQVFLYIWFFLLPLALIETGGWFTILWAVLITYGIGMLFVIAMALNSPYGYDLQDIKLNRIASKAALNAINAYCLEERVLSELIKPVHNTPRWLETDREGHNPKDYGSQPTGLFSSWVNKCRTFRLGSPKKEVAIPMTLFLAWVAFIVFFTWQTAKDRGEVPGSCRWWCIYIPVSTDTTSYVGLGIFLLLGFWINDQYARYWNGLQLWQTDLKSSMSRLLFQAGFLFKSGTWHERDIERLFSHIAALPVASKLKLRDSRKMSEFDGILSQEDIDMLEQSTDLTSHCNRVIFAYMNSVDRRDKDTLASGKRPGTASFFNIMMAAWNVEKVLNKCNAMRKAPISASFTIHLQVFSLFWLALLPLAFVGHDGFMSFLYLPPIAYSILRLIIMGKELDDPFGEDPNDIPLDALCEDMKNLVHDVYEETRSGPASFVHQGAYSSELVDSGLFERPRHVAVDEGLSLAPSSPAKTLSLIDLLRRVRTSLPSVPWVAQVAITIWAAAAVLMSFALSKLWKDRDLNCTEWCSPVDVDSRILVESGFALFLIISFRAADAMNRYQNGAAYLAQLEMYIRSLLMEMTSAYEQGSWHANDKERFVAHLVQIPLFLRDSLLGDKRSAQEGLLSEEDYNACARSADPVRYCLQLGEAYLLSYDVPACEWDFTTAKEAPRPPITVSQMMMRRISQIGETVSKVEGIKRFPMVKSYTSHQRLFTAVWLLLVPFGLTPHTGFFAILWAPLISYGVLALESLATTLVDPFGDDVMDLPVEAFCRESAGRLLEAVRSAKWDIKYHVTSSPRDADARIGTLVDGREMRDRYSLAQFSQEEVDAENFANYAVVEFAGPRIPMMKPTLLSHMLRSVPWWTLLQVMAWTTLGVLISYVSRTSNEDARWWESRIRVDGIAATYVGFAAFVQLGFYAHAAFSRHQEAGKVWGDDLRAVCHSVAVQFYLLADAGIWHAGDLDRIVAHIAAIPVALKMELRDSRDMRELTGLLSQRDVGRLLAAESMSSHCVDVIKTYYLAGKCRPGSLVDSSKVIKDPRQFYIIYDIQKIEEAICNCKTLKEFPMAPGSMIVLRSLLAIWFLIIPFVLAETTGWFTILWVQIIAYGLIGMYTIAGELEQPFGTDLNDIDLDEMADEIVRDVLFVQQNHRGGTDTLVVKLESSGQAWQILPHGDAASNTFLPSLVEDNKGRFSESRWKSFRVTLHAIPFWMLLGLALWSAILVLLAWLLHKKWPMKDMCAELSFCSPIGIDSVVKGYVGFALFLLLGQRIQDCHWRYVSALHAWKEGIIGITRVLSNRILESYPSGSIHKGDTERIVAHIAAFSVVTAARLRRDDSYGHFLSQIMNPEDIERIDRVEHKGDYCLDVVRAYLSEAEERRNPDGAISNGGILYWKILGYLGSLKDHAAACQRMISVPLPFGYVQHIRILTVTWLLLLPLGLVESSGWWSIAWVVFVAYGVIGMELWSSELADPFGNDISDIPLGNLRAEAVATVRSNFKWFKDGNQSVVIEPERTAFPARVNP